MLYNRLHANRGQNGSVNSGNGEQSLRAPAQLESEDTYDKQDLLLQQTLEFEGVRMK